MSSKPSNEKHQVPHEVPPVGSETSNLVRKAVTGEAQRAWPALSEKIVAYLRPRFGHSAFPPGIEFHDFVSDLMAKVMTSIKNFEDRGRDSFWRWVQTIGGNLSRDMWRRFERDRRLGLAGRGEAEADADAPPRGIDAAAATGETPTGIVRFRELEKAEQECTAKLGKTMRDVYVMRRQHELSFAEIAAHTGIANQATLRSHYMRAREQIRECLAKKIDELGKQLKGWQ
jgi:RNA polymerase sigma factor (sigma-70 family)